MNPYNPNINKDEPLSKEEVNSKLLEAEASLKKMRSAKFFWFSSMSASIVAMLVFVVIGYDLAWLLSILFATVCFIFLGMAESRTHKLAVVVISFKPVCMEDIETIEKCLIYKPVQDFRDKVVKIGRELTTGELNAFKLYSDRVELRHKLNKAYDNDYNLVEKAFSRVSNDLQQSNSPKL